MIKGYISDMKIKQDAIFVSVAAALSAVLLIGLYFFLGFLGDSGNGIDSSDSAAYYFVKAVSKNDSKKVMKCLLSSSRDAGFKLDTMSLAPISDMKSKYTDVNISNMVIDSVVDLSDQCDSLSGGYYSIYNADEEFTDARKYIMSSRMKCSSEDKPEENFNIIWNIITVKSARNKKWYVYTGQQLTEDLSREDADLVNIYDINDTLDTSSDFVDYDVTNDQVYDIMYTKIQSVNKTVKALNFYSDAAKDLSSGKLWIDSFEYFMPITYQSTLNFITINDDKLEDSQSVVPANSIIKRVPVSFSNIIYSKTGISVNIGNPTNSPIDIYGGTIVGLYLSIPEQDIYDYPDVYLPGNVTFGTEYKDVARMYGELTLYDGSNSDLKLYSDSVKIYQKDLNNERNHVYFEFENDKLVAIQYYYFDLTA